MKNAYISPEISFLTSNDVVKLSGEGGAQGGNGTEHVFSDPFAISGL